MRSIFQSLQMAEVLLRMVQYLQEYLVTKDSEDYYNTVIFNYKNKNVIKKSIEEAKKLLVKAGYSNGINQETGKPLVLYFEATGAGADTYAFLNWLRKQFKKINIQLVTRV